LPEEKDEYGRNNYKFILILECLNAKVCIPKDEILAKPKMQRSQGIGSMQFELKENCITASALLTDEG